MGIYLKIDKRTVKEENGFRIFQKKVLESITSNRRLIMAEAPVGAGKSFIVKKMITNDRISHFPVILTFPTKILMDTQIKSLKKELSPVKHWPDETDIKSRYTIFEYSSDALFRFLKRNPEVFNLNKSEIIYSVLKNQMYSAKNNIIVTTPDVLHLIKNNFYYNANRIKSLLNGAIVVFDEFHLYTNLANFIPLIKWLIDILDAKILFLSATPIISEELNVLFNTVSSEIIDFRDSIGGAKDKIFNYPLDMYIEECKYTQNNIFLSVVQKYISNLPMPLGIIFDSVFRLRHIKSILQKNFGREFNLIEYSGMKKESTKIDDKTIVLGTSSIEVGVELPLKSLITESAYWTSAIQRIGRVGRFEPASVVILTKKRFSPFVSEGEKLTRSFFENEVLKRALKDTIGTFVSGEMFRGDSYPFWVIDEDTKDVIYYTESIFSIYNIDPQYYINNWRQLDEQNKRDILKKDFSLKDFVVEEILLKEKIFPAYGVVKGRLRQEYEPIIVKKGNIELEISLKNQRVSYYFKLGGLYKDDF